MGRREARWPYAVSGLLAAAAGVAVGHLAAAFVNPAASPVLAVGSAVIDSTPTPVKEWAVQTLGTHDKPVLLTGVAVVTALVAAAIGLLGRTRPTPAQLLILLLGVLPAAAALTRAGAAQQDVLPSVATAITGVVTLAGLRRALAGPRTAPTGSRPESPLDHTAYGTGEAATPPRRTFLVGAAGVAAGAAVLGTAGQRLGVPATLPASLALPKPATPAPTLPRGIEAAVRGVSPFRTPVGDFYRVDTALVVPRVDAATWQLEVGGQVDRPLRLSLQDLFALPALERDITLNCVSNTVGGPYIGSARWLGVRVRDVLERAGVHSGADQVLSESADGFTVSTPIEALTDDRDAMLVYAMDGAPLPAKHGFPVRLLTPGLYGYVGATKWLTRLTATTFAAQQSYWTQRGWAAQAPVKTQSRIDTPQGLATYRPGTIAIGGVAWAQGRGISRVEVRVDGGPWRDAVLGPDAGTDYWRQWHVAWDATPGRHELTCRATDGTGAVQTSERADPFPSGASGYHSVVVIIAS